MKKAMSWLVARREAFVVVDGFGKVHSLARQVQEAKTKQVNAKLPSISPDQLPSVDQAKEAVLRRGADAKARVDVRVNRRMAELSGKLKIQQAGRRLKLDGRKQEIDTEHASERMALHAAHKSEAQKPFTRAAGAIFALFDRVPGLRSVIAPLRRNPKINPAERHRLETRRFSSSADNAMPGQLADPYAWPEWPYWPDSDQLNVFHEICVEKLFFMGYDRNSTGEGFREGNSRSEIVFQETSGERAIFRDGERFS